MTDEQYYLIRDMQNLLVKYCRGIDDYETKTEIYSDWLEFCRKLFIDTDRILFTCASGNSMIGDYSIKGFMDGNEERKEAEFKRKEKLKRTQHWKRKKKGR